MIDNKVDKFQVEPAERSVAEALVKASDSTKVVAYSCATCGTVYKDKSSAERCPGVKCTKWTCKDCGQESRPYQLYCPECISKRYTASEEKRLMEVEEVIPWHDYPDDQGIVWDNTYHQSIEDLDEACALEGIEFPKRVWATIPKAFKLDADDILSAAFEEWADGSDVDPNYSGEGEFRKAVKAFNRANENLVMFQEVDKVVDLTDYPRD